MNAHVSSFRVGPLSVFGEGWSDEWIAYAAARFPSDHAPSGYPLRVRQLVTKPLDVVDGTREFACERIAGGRWRIGGVFTLHAVFDPMQGVLDAFGADAPHITIGNALRATAALVLPLHLDGLMLHASSAVLAGEGVAFAGVSTAGKTTLAQGLQAADALSDDISIVTESSALPRLRASPFYGAAGAPGCDSEGRLAALALLGKSTNGTRVAPVERAQAVAELARHTVCFSHDVGLQRAILERLVSLVERVPVLRVERDRRDASDEILQRTMQVASSIRAGAFHRTAPYTDVRSNPNVSIATVEGRP